MKAYFSLSNVCAHFWAIGLVLAQFEGPYAEDLYTDAKSGIIVDNHLIARELAPGGLEFGAALPAKLDKPDYIGRMVGPKDGWTGVSHNGGMRNTVLLAAWADGDKIQHSFRYATDYMERSVYLYNRAATASEISHKVNATHFEFIYRCTSCFEWEWGATKGSQAINGTSVSFGFAQSGRKLADTKNPDVHLVDHEVFGLIEMGTKKAANAKYDSWASKAATKPVLRRQVNLPRISPPAVPPGLPKADDPKLPIPVSSLGMPPFTPKAHGAPPGALSTNLPKEKEKAPHEMRCRMTGDCLLVD